jgi:hypothetical protein
MAKSSPTHEPTASTRKQVSSMSMAGIRQEVIADIIDIDPKTLRKYYRKELDHATAKVITSVAGKLYEQCMGGNTSAMMFLLKTRGGWRESDQEQQKDGSPQKVTIEVVGANTSN